MVSLTRLHFGHIREFPPSADNLVGEIDEPSSLLSFPRFEQVYAHHLNPRFYERIRQELGQLGIPYLTALEEGRALPL